jgi:hypothetical protein
MSEVDYKTLEAWSRDAVELLRAAGLSPTLAKMELDSIEKHSGTKAIFTIAEDLAEGICDLSPTVREIAQTTLKKTHGFGYELFTDAKMKRVRAILKHGHIKDEDEYRALLDVASDTTISDALRDTLTKALAAHEARQSKGDRQPKGPKGDGVD